MEKNLTKKIFEDLTHKSISEADAEEFEGNLREYFSILVEWFDSNNNKKEKNNA